MVLRSSFGVIHAGVPGGSTSARASRGVSALSLVAIVRMAARAKNFGKFSKKLDDRQSLFPLMRLLTTQGWLRVREVFFFGFGLTGTIAALAGKFRCCNYHYVDNNRYR
jgi:hypothetical protein